METLGTTVPDHLMTTVASWLHRGVGCFVGRAGYGRGRFAVAVVRTPAEFDKVRAKFGDALADRELLSCLVLVEPDNGALTKMTATDLVRYLDSTYFSRDRVSRRRSVAQVQGYSYNLSYLLRCPVTGVMTTYSDFDQVAFYPQATDTTDPLYDPSMHAPFVCINITSDVYGYSLAVADIHRRGQVPRPPFAAMTAAARREIYRQALHIFQGLAEKTICHYGDATDPAVLEPIHLVHEGRYYIAQHDEAAFAEEAKLPFRNEMPVRYAPRIIDQWERYFLTGLPPDMSQVYSPSAPIHPERPKSAPRAA